MTDGDAPTPTTDTGGDGGNRGGDADRTFTQAELDRIVGERVGRERQKYADYDDLKAQAGQLAEIEESKKSDLEKISGERDELKAQLEPAKVENLRLRVAVEKRLPAELIDRLKGASREEMEADADELLKLVKPASGGQLDGGARGGVEPGDDMNALLRRAAGRA